MSARGLAYAVFIFIMAINGFVLATAEVRVTSWQYWVVTLSMAIVFICGIFRGVVK